MTPREPREPRTSPFEFQFSDDWAHERFKRLNLHDLDTAKDVVLELASYNRHDQIREYLQFFLSSGTQYHKGAALVRLLQQTARQRWEPHTHRARILRIGPPSRIIAAEGETDQAWEDGPRRLMERHVLGQPSPPAKREDITAAVERMIKAAQEEPRRGSRELTLDEIAVRYRGQARPIPPMTSTPNALIPHDGSVLAYLNGDAGHAFTGIVCGGDLGDESGRPQQRHVIYLVPVLPSQGGNRDPDKVYMVRTPRGGSSAMIHGREMAPIHHLAGGSAPSHEQLIDRLAKTHTAMTRESGHAIGFTLSKGSWSCRFPDRLSFTSQSANSFSMRRTSPEYSVTEAWGRAIHQAFESMTFFEIIVCYLFGTREAAILNLKQNPGLFEGLMDFVWATGPRFGAHL